MATTSRYTLLGSGANFMDFYIPYGDISLDGQEIVFKGNSLVDSVYIGSSAGLIFDFTQAGLGVDKLYLSGSWADYSRSYSGSVVTLTRIVGGNEVVKAISGDSLVFADGTVAVQSALSFLASGAAEPVPAGEKSTAFPMTLTGALNNNVRAVVQDAAGETIALSRPGVALIVKGGSGVDVVYVKAGANVDGSQLGLGQDKLYLAGNWADYAGAVAGSVVTLTRTVGANTETVKFLGGSINAYDSVIFANGTAKSIDILNYLKAPTTVPQPSLSALEITPLLVQDKTFMTVAQLDAAFQQTGVTPTVTKIVDTASNLMQNGWGVTPYAAAGVRVFVTDSISIADLVAISAQTGMQTLAASIVDTVANLTTNPGLGYVQSGVNVTVIDDATIAQLNTLNASNGAGVVKASSITDTAANLASGGVASLFVTPGVAVNVTAPILLTDLAAIDAANGGGALTYVGVSGTLTELNNSVATTGGYLHPDNPAASGVAVVVSGTADMLSLMGFEQATTLVPTATSIADTAQNLSDFSQYISSLGSGTAVTVTDAISVGALRVIDGLNGNGVLSYSLIDTLGNLTDTLGNLPGTDYSAAATNITVTNDATIAQLVALKPTANMTATTIVDVAANLVSGTTASPYIKSGVNVTVTDTISLADLAKIDTANGIGALTYSAVSGTLNEINAASVSGGYLDPALTNIAVTVTDAVNLGQLAGLLDNTAIAQSIATSIADSATNLFASGGVSSYVTDGVAVSVTGNVTLAQLALIDAAANGTATVAVSATSGVISDVAANLVVNGVVSTYVQSGTSVNVTDEIAYADLVLLDGQNGAGALTYAGVSGTLSQLNSTSPNPNYVVDGVAVTVTDAASISQLATLDGKNGQVAAVKATTITDAVDALMTDMLGGGTGYVADGVAVTVTGTLSVDQLSAIDAKNVAGSVTVSSLTDTTAKLSIASQDYSLTGVALTVIDAVTIDQLAPLDLVNNGATVTVASTGSISGSASQWATARTAYSFDGTAVTVTDTITIPNLALLDQANGSAAVTYGGIADTQGTAGTSDVLSLSNALSAIDLGTYNQTGTALLQGFEIFDLATDTGANSVTLTAASVFLQASNLSNASAQVLTVTGTASDTVTLSAADFALQGASFNADGTAGTGYSKYVATYVDTSNHMLEVMVQAGVVVVL